MPIIDIEPSPTAWLTQRLPRRFDQYASDPDSGRWYTIHDLATDDGVLLRAWHARRRAVECLVEVLTPIIDICHDLGRTGRVGLWNEVADSLGLSVAHRPDIPARDDIVVSLASAVRTAGVPWRATPSLRIVGTDHGPVYIGQKGGCCLAYTCPGQPPDGDDDHRAYLARFPELPDEPRYCSTCKFREPTDSEQRQRFWIERCAAG